VSVLDPPPAAATVPDDDRPARDRSTVERGRRSRAGLVWWLLVIGIALGGLVMRAWNLDFDQRQHQHPDERYWSIVSAELRQQAPDERHGTFAGPVLDWLDGDRSPANVYRDDQSFAYGPTMLAVSRGVAGWLAAGAIDDQQPARTVVHAIDALGVPLLDDEGAPRFDDGYEVDLVGRLLGALLDTITIVVVALIGRRVGGRVAGLAAAAFFATCVLAIQHTHFLGAEPALGLAAAAMVLAAVHLDRSASVRRAVGSGALVGLAGGAAIAAKLSAAPLVAVPLIGCIALAWTHRRRADLVRVAVLAVSVVVAFRVLHPAAFRGLGMMPSRAFLDDLGRLRAQFGGADVPPSIQWADRSYVAQSIEWMVRFTIGPGMALAALVGAVALIDRLRPRRSPPGERWPALVMLGAVVMPFGYIVSAADPFGRYFMPLVPALCATAGLGVGVAWHRATELRPRTRVALRVGAVATIALGALWAVSFVNGIYGATNTRVEATRWIVEHVPPGSALTSQAWDDSLPLRLPGVDAERYEVVQLEMVGTDTEDKVERVAAQLGGVDYVVESSPRLWASVVRIPERFPSTINFFEALDDGTLGFERVATFDRDPSLGPFRLDDAAAEEAFSVYDHPEVRIWRKERTVPYRELVSALDPVAASRAMTVTAADAGAGGLLLTDDEAAALESGTTFDARFDTDGPSWLHAAGWLVLVELMGFAAFAIALPLFRRLPDAGAGIARTVGLGLTGFAAFVASAWLHVPLTRATVGAVVGLLLLGGGLAVGRHRHELRELWATRRRMLVAVEALGLTAFAGVLALRAANPDLWHPARSGEKPFELALLTAVLRTDSLPPYDAWFAGGVLNYYYGGYLVLLAPARVLTTAPSMVMNIGIAVFAMAAAGAAATLAAAVEGSRRRTPGRPLAAAVLGTFAVLALPNLAVLGELWQRWRSGPPFDWWAVSRVVPGTTDITEFPAWSLLFADLHPHVMDLPVLLTSGVLAIVLHRHLVDRATGRAIVTALAVGASIGLVRATNTWDYPLVAGCAVTAIVLAARQGARRSTCARVAAAVAGVVFGVWAPYVRRGLVFDGGAQRAVARTPWASWVVQFGLFALVTAALVLPPLVRASRRSASSRTIERRVGGAHVAPIGMALVGIALVAGGTIAVWPESAVAVTVALLTAGAGWVAWTRRRRTDGVPPLAAALMSAGWCLQLGVELLTVRNDTGRQNTVFKFWYQSWTLLAIGSAVAVVAWLPHRSTAHAASRTGRPARTGRTAAAAGVAGAALLAAAFWVYAVPTRLDDRLSGGWTLDGEAFLQSDDTTGYQEQTIVPGEDAPLIGWLRGNVSGVRTIAEAPGDDYLWSARIAAFTGLPTPSGWRFHEVQQRRAYGDVVERRAALLRTLYTSTDPAELATSLTDLDVDLVVFGVTERAIASRQSRAALHDFECLDVEFESGDLFVARVDRECALRIRPVG
jgi:YYY domain-containing protein